jgi:integrase
LVLVDFSGRNGLRPAEARAVRWVDVDLDQGELHVTGKMNRANQRSDVKRALNAARSILIDDTTIAMLTAWRDRQQQFRERAGSAWTDTGLIATTNQGTPVDRHSVTRSIRLYAPRPG